MEPVTPTSPDPSVDPPAIPADLPAPSGPRCFECGIGLDGDERYRATGICGSCGARMAISADQWIELLFDQDSFDEHFAGLVTPDPLQFSDSRPYPERIEEAATRPCTSGLPWWVAWR
jgi:acetyl-CoA carboxylase carboxyl transferase subunit beta